ncbi:polyamine aminopropyltransferase [Brevibacterium sp. UCMA 11752]|uniref:polyamine aminopropyltransferase n=1 Tax=Brevibacterium sp. UCMA 11752 TaxID=2745946 RepID=UPI001F1F0A25|nr:polyamine aminopropyltransferase [Brevibacterium sp. UCMA 11752]MCF2589117.1 polyamine aminopropyltransferase [Brevibacterium sp. UCMA 11752]
MSSPTESSNADTIGGSRPITLPLKPGPARFFVLLAVFICASCGMVYELALVALGSYLLGDTIVQASIVLSVMVFAMGIGSLATKRLTEFAAVAFALIEAALGIIGGLSVILLYLAFAFADVYTVAMVALAFVIGALIGAEIPLLMELVQRIRAQKASSAVADLFAADYVGGLVGGLAFPFILLPVFGLPRGALAVGITNAVVGILIVLWLFRTEIRTRTQVILAGLLVLIVGGLTVVWVFTDDIEMTTRQRLYRDPIVYSQRTDYQEIVLTESQKTGDTRLYLNGDLQFASADEYRYHESLVHPLMDGPKRNVLVLGGGDGLAVREILKYPDVESVTLVDLDPRVLELAKTSDHFTDFNEDSLDDPRVRTIAADAFTWLREAEHTAYDAVIADLPDPDDVATSKLYSIEFYGLIKQVMSPEARLVVQAGSPYFAPEAYWGIGEAVAEAGLTTTPYHVDVPSFGDWGYFLADASDHDGTSDKGPDVTMPADAPGGLKFATPEVLASSTTFPPDRDRASVGDVEASTLLHPRVLDQERGAWVGY